MTQDEIIAIYIEVSNKLCNGTEWCWSGVDEPLQLFAKLVAEHEREECAKLCDDELKEWGIFDSDLGDISKAIRARGQE